MLTSTQLHKKIVNEESDRFYRVMLREEKLNHPEAIQKSLVSYFNGRPDLFEHVFKYLYSIFTLCTISNK